MKRYLAFYGDCYYAGGGMNDFVNDFNSAIAKHKTFYTH